MRQLSDMLVEVVKINHGEMVTKIRLQKTMYFLWEMRLLSGVDDPGFEYRHYGPFSEDLAFAADDAVAEGKLATEPRFGRHSEPYTIFKTTEKQRPVLALDEHARIGAALRIFRRYTGMEMELASSVHFLRGHGYPGDAAVNETRIRKPLKATDARLERARKLLREIEELGGTTAGSMRTLHIEEIGD